MYENIIKICIFLFLYHHNVISYDIYQLDSAESNKLLPKIRQLLLNQRNDEPDYENRYAKGKQTQLKPMGKSVFVKRIIPHGYKTGDYEYDSKLNTVFKPLARYHVQKPNEDQENSILQDTDDQKQRDDFEKDLIVLVQKEEGQQDLLQQIQKYINQNTRQQKQKKKAKARFRGLFNKLKNKLLLLRDKSGEIHDPLAPGKIPENLLTLPSSSSEESEEKTVYPSYPFWNYWTYHKNIYQDRCPGNLVKMGNTCVSSIGHRRFADPGDTRRSNHNQHKRRRSIRAARKRHLYGDNS